MVEVFAVVRTGDGLTVTTTEYGFPGQLPETDVGVMMYVTVPEEDPLGLVSTWLMVEPEPAVAPVIEPVTVPMVQENVLGTVAVKAIFVLLPL